MNQEKDQWMFEFPVNKEKIEEETRKFIKFNRENACILMLDDKDKQTTKDGFPNF
jgi:hypothetical protein